MQELDKAAMGRRIRQIRLGAGLRQWELARLLGTTQSAVHKYEHGVVPEPRRLVELARVGGTSVEWVLTGHHWENGSQEQRRVSAEVLDTASLLQEIDQDERATIGEALRLIRDAVQTVGRAGAGPPSAPGAEPARVVGALQDHGEQTMRLLESAWRVQRRVLERVAREARARLEAGTDSDPGSPAG